MRPSMFMGASGVRPAEFVGATKQNTTGSVTALDFASIPGLQVGDYVIATATSTGASGYASMTTAGWNADNYTWPTYGYRATTLHRQIDTLAAPVLTGTGGSTSILITAHRGASRASRKVIAHGNDGSSLVVPGIIRPSDCVGLVCSIFDRDGGSADFTPSAGWTRRILETAGSFRISAADALPRNAYADGAALDWSSLGPSLPQVAMMYELRI